MTIHCSVLGPAPALSELRESAQWVWGEAWFHPSWVIGHEVIFKCKDESVKQVMISGLDVFIRFRLVKIVHKLLI